MRRIGRNIKNISTDASSNSQYASDEVIHATLTPLRSIDAFVERAEVLDKPGGDIVLMLRKAEAELKVDLFLNMRWLMSTLFISNMNQKKVSSPGL